MIILPNGLLNPTQQLFIEDESPFSLFSGGFGSGKSVAARIKAMVLKGINGTVPGLLMAPTHGALFSLLVDPLMNMYEAMLPAYKMPKVISDNKGRKEMQFPDGSKIYLRSAENIASFDGIDCGWLVGDELRHFRRKSYSVAIARVRVKAAKVCQRAFTSTPEIGFMSDDFNAGKKGFAVFNCGTRENAHNLADGYIEGLEQSYSDRMARAVLEGCWTVVEGAVFSDFDPSVETSPWIVDFRPSRHELSKMKIYLAVDPGFQRSAWLFIAERSPLDWVVFDQLMLNGCSDQAAVEIVNNRGWPIDEIWIDPAADNTQSFDGYDTITAIKNIRTRKKHPIHLINKYREIKFGVDKLRVLLGGYNKMPIRISFNRQMAEAERGQERGIVKDLASLRYPEMKDGRPVVDVPLKDGITDHSTDALRYYAVSRWLREKSLRKLDRDLAADDKPGYTVKTLA